MNVTWTIIQREYLTRVMKKSFLITTLIVPMLIAGCLFLGGYIASKSNEKQTIVVHDESNYFQAQLKSNNENFAFLYEKSIANESSKDALKRNKADILLKIDPFKNGRPNAVNLYKEGGVSAGTKTFIDNEINDLYEIEQMNLVGINRAQIDSIHQSEITLRSFDIKDNQETSSEIAMGIGYAMGILIYFVIFIYGTSVMRGVMEEKTNRIAEVIISSVKPFQLMMGKIVGIALVGLTQFAMWFLVTITIKMVTFNLLPSFTIEAVPNVGMESLASNAALQNPDSINHLLQLLLSQNWVMIIGLFVFYFLGGYFLYASLFAAVGSLVNEDPQEAQQLSIPISMPIVLGFVIMTSAMENPHSPIAIFGSLFPLTSPIVMMARIPYHPPVWQIILSMVFLVACFVLMTWLGAKIYRTGILMYGKKANFKDIWTYLRK
jgi:ABC-2 type transport system permease protein